MKYWYFENEEVGAYAVEADDFEEAQAQADACFPIDEYGENVGCQEPMTVDEVDMEGLDVI